MQLYQKMAAENKTEIYMQWIPAHLGIISNTQADDIAKKELINTTHQQQLTHEIEQATSKTML